MNCTNCGHKFEPQHNFCQNCGAAQTKTLEANTNPTKSEYKLVYLNEDFIKSEEFNNIVKSNIDYYSGIFMRLQPIANKLVLNMDTDARKFNLSEIQDSKNILAINELKLGGFNWGAMLFGPAWFAYRNMNKVTIYLTIMFFAIDLIAKLEKPYRTSWNGLTVHTGGSAFWYYILNISYVALWIAFAFLANSMYFVHINKNLRVNNGANNIVNFGGVNLSKMFGVLLIMIIWQVALS